MARAPLFNGEAIIGEVISDEEVVANSNEPILIIRLEKQAGLVQELMKEELIYFDIVNIPAVRA
jgi:hypothetical protein